MLFKIVNGSVSFGADTVLERVDFEINAGEKIAIIGRNGCGKSTLLKCISGELSMEEGTGDTPFSISKSGNPTIGYLKQISFEDENISMIDEVLKVYSNLFEIEDKLTNLLEKLQTNPDEETVKKYSTLNEKFEFLGGYTYKKEYNSVIKQFGFTESDKLKKISQFSGGQRTKIAFIKLLLSHPDILLLDEPTNHLDASAVKWLETYIKCYKSAVVIVSHDRMFIEKTTDVVYEIEYGETTKYKGNFSDFERQKRTNYDKQLKDHEYQREEIARLMKVVERFRYKATKAKMVQSKLKMIEHMKIIDKPNRYDLKTFHANFKPLRNNVKIALTVNGLSIGYNTPLANLNLELLNGQKLGVLGDNGVGKSTFLKTIANKLKPLNGNFLFGVNSDIGYFDQQMAEISGNETVLDNFQATFPQYNVTEARSSLGAFLFSGEDVFKKISELSGGERVRLALCKIFKRRPNVLILDEPTNHMDIVGKETIENMLKEYEGTVIVVSHDRYFINKIADKLLVFENGETTLYPFGYTQYELLLKEREEAIEKQKQTTVVNTSTGKKTFSTPLKDRGKKERRVKRLEELMGVCQNKKAELETELEKPEIYSDYIKVGEIQTQLDKLTTELNLYEEEWLSLTEELENLT